MEDYRTIISKLCPEIISEEIIIKRHTMTFKSWDKWSTGTNPIKNLCEVNSVNKIFHIIHYINHFCYVLKNIPVRYFTCSRYEENPQTRPQPGFLFGLRPKSCFLHEIGPDDKQKNSRREFWDFLCKASPNAESRSNSRSRYINK
jgi:hypothetical protein